MIASLRPRRRVGDHVVYFALRPDAAAAEAAFRLAERLRGGHGLTGRPTPPDRLHVSLNGLGISPPAQTIERAAKAVAGLARPAFRVAFNRVASFGRGEGQRSLVVRGDEGVIGVDLLHGAIHAALAEPGLKPRRQRAFEAHMTLLRDEREVAETVLDAPIAWTVREFVLIDSLFGEGRHEVLGRWALA